MSGVGPRRALAILMAAGAIACGGGEEPASDPSGIGGRGGAQTTAPIDDAQIAALIGLINGTELAAAKAVQPKLASPAARAYAGVLIADHTRLMDAMPSFQGPAVPPPQARTLAAVFHSQAEMMATLPAGYPFDATYLATQVADHAMAIDSLRRWHGVAEDGSLQRAIAAAVPVMQAHLDAAKSLYTQLDQRVDLGRSGPADTVRPVTAPGPGTVPADTAAPPVGPAPDSARADTPSTHDGHGS